MSTIIQATELSKSYFSGGREVPVLHDISITFRKEFTCILGASGSGKTTLLSLIGTLDNPTSGKIEIGGVEVAGLKGNQLADFRFAQIGFVFQQFHLLPTLTAIENVLSPFFGRKKIRTKHAKATDLLEKLGIEDKAQLLPWQLSGGEQQRVAIARALANEPKWLLADEPTGNLDSRNAESLYQLLKKVQADLGCGMIVVTHDQKLADKADRVIEIQDGEIAADWVPQELVP